MGIRRRAGAALVAAVALGATVLGQGGVAQAYGTYYPNGYYHVIASHSGKCLDVAHASQAHGADVIQGTCTWTGWNQQWYLENMGNGQFRLKARHSGMCLDVHSASQAHGADVVQAWCWGYPAAANQLWSEGHVDSSWAVELKPAHSYPRMCLDVAHLSTAHGANVIQGSCWGGPNQHWWLAPLR